MCVYKLVDVLYLFIFIKYYAVRNINSQINPVIITICIVSMFESAASNDADGGLISETQSAVAHWHRRTAQGEQRETTSPPGGWSYNSSTGLMAAELGRGHD